MPWNICDFVYCVGEAESNITSWLTSKCFACLSLFSLFTSIPLGQLSLERDHNTDGDSFIPKWSCVKLFAPTVTYFVF